MIELETRVIELEAELHSLEAAYGNVTKINDELTSQSPRARSHSSERFSATEYVESQRKEKESLELLAKKDVQLQMAGMELTRLSSQLNEQEPVGSPDEVTGKSGDPTLAAAAALPVSYAGCCCCAPCELRWLLLLYSL